MAAAVAIGLEHTGQPLGVQAFNDFARALESDYAAITAFKQHCRMMAHVNGALDRLVRKRATAPTDFLTIAASISDMRLSLVEHVLSLLQAHVQALVVHIPTETPRGRARPATAGAPRVQL